VDRKVIGLGIISLTIENAPRIRKKDWMSNLASASSVDHMATWLGFVGTFLLIRNDGKPVDSMRQDPIRSRSPRRRPPMGRHGSPYRDHSPDYPPYRGGRPYDPYYRRYSPPPYDRYDYRYREYDYYRGYDDMAVRRERYPPRERFYEPRDYHMDSRPHRDSRDFEEPPADSALDFEDAVRDPREIPPSYIEDDRGREFDREHPRDFEGGIAPGYDDRRNFYYDQYHDGPSRGRPSGYMKR
jgi:hypothetical protein